MLGTPFIPCPSPPVAGVQAIGFRGNAQIGVANTFLVVRPSSVSMQLRLGLTEAPAASGLGAHDVATAALNESVQGGDPATAASTHSATSSTTLSEPVPLVIFECDSTFLPMEGDCRLGMHLFRQSGHSSTLCLYMTHSLLIPEEARWELM